MVPLFFVAFALASIIIIKSMTLSLTGCRYNQVVWMQKEMTYNLTLELLIVRTNSKHGTIVYCPVDLVSLKPIKTRLV